MIEIEQVVLHYVLIGVLRLEWNVGLGIGEKEKNEWNERDEIDSIDNGV